MAKNSEVEKWLESLDHPLKEAILLLRGIVLRADRRIGECIKWQSPTFTLQGNIASINPKSKSKISLMFHKGASIPGKHPRLTGGGGTVKFMYFEDARDVKDSRREIEAVFKACCAMPGA